MGRSRQARRAALVVGMVVAAAALVGCQTAAPQAADGGGTSAAAAPEAAAAVVVASASVEAALRAGARAGAEAVTGQVSPGAVEVGGRLAGGAVSALPPRLLPEGYLAFGDACGPGETVTIAAVGDLLIHRELQRQAWEEPDHFASIWRGVSDLIAQADVAYANLEGPTAPGLNRRGEPVEDPGERFDNKVYTGYARFNYHPRILTDLVETGFDVVSTANNHALDRGPLGVDRTIAQLEAAGLPFTGTRRGDETARDRPWYTITEAAGFRLAWLACADHTNGIEDPHGQTLLCFDQEDEVLGTIRELAARDDVDAVIVTPHWGKEYVHEPNREQVRYAHRFIEAGATLVIGNHPHVIQPWEKYVTEDGREGLIMYSLGNFASHQPDLPKRSTVLLYVGLTRGVDGRARVNGARYVLLHTRHDEARDFYFTEAIDRVGGWQDARQLLISLMGPWNRMDADEPLVTNPHCDLAWGFPGEP